MSFARGEKYFSQVKKSGLGFCFTTKITFLNLTFLQRKHEKIKFVHLGSD